MKWKTLVKIMKHIHDKTLCKLIDGGELMRQMHMKIHTCIDIEPIVSHGISTMLT